MRLIEGENRQSGDHQLTAHRAATPRAITSSARRLRHQQEKGLLYQKDWECVLNATLREQSGTNGTSRGRD